MINQFDLMFIVMTIKKKIDSVKNKGKKESTQSIFINII